MAKKNQNPLSVLALVLSVIALVLSVYTLSNSGGGGGGVSDKDFQAQITAGIDKYINDQRAAQPGAAPSPGAGTPVDVSADDDPFKGDKNAPVTIIEFSDYECPFCARFYSNTLPQIVSEYIDTGKVRFVYRDFPLSFHRNARPAAMAAECVGDQGGDEMYFKFHDKIFENQTAGLSTENLTAWATEVGANTSEFTSCLESEKFGEEVDKDFADGQAAGISGTPGFFINGRKISGAQPFSVFKAIIDEELAK